MSEYLSKPSVLKSETIPIITEADIVTARHRVRQWALELKFSLVDQTKIVTAASELARNTVVYAKEGKMILEAIQDRSRDGLRVIFQDRGPGIPDVDLAFRDGYTTGGGLGLGLGGAKRLVNELEIHTVLGQGTCIAITRWK